MDSNETQAPLHESHPLGPLYIAVERFDARRGDDWNKYIAWSGLTHVSEIVSLDSILCPRVIEKIIDEDWPHIVNENFMLDYFVDLDYLLERAGSMKGKNLLCVVRNPQVEPQPPLDPVRFELLGYDLVDVHGAVSAITNCGGFPDIFSGSELNTYGLIGSLGRAREIRNALFAKYQGESHSQTHVWGVCRAIAL
jgi:hypothetical protein